MNATSMKLIIAASEGSKFFLSFCSVCLCKTIVSGCVLFNYDLVWAGKSQVFQLLKKFFFFYLYVHTMFGSFLPPSPHPLTYPPTPSLPGRNYFALVSNFVEERV
jgi:hypothetical protein